MFILVVVFVILDGGGCRSCGSRCRRCRRRRLSLSVVGYCISFWTSWAAIDSVVVWNCSSQSRRG